MTGIAFVAASAAALLSFAGTAGARRFALARAVLDVPNERSSHAVPTPRGGGIAVVAGVLLGMAVLAVAGAVPERVAVGLGGGTIVVAVAGWLDDLRGMSKSVRLTAQLAGAVWALAWLGWLPSVRLGGTTWALGWWGAVPAALWIVWATNLYNFMDGVDGIAAVEAVCVGVAAACLLAVTGAASLGTVSLVVAAAALGFLPWNWAPARIFLGDVGSGALGFLFAGLSVASENARSLPLPLWLLLMGVFVFDATVTLLRRVAASEPWSEGHRKHAYQRLTRAGWGHARVSVAVGVLNVGLSLLAWLAVAVPSTFFPVCLAGLGLLCGAYLVVERVFPMTAGPGTSAETKEVT